MKIQIDSNTALVATAFCLALMVLFVASCEVGKARAKYQHTDNEQTITHKG